MHFCITLNSFTLCWVLLSPVGSFSMHFLAKILCPETTKIGFLSSNAPVFRLYWLFRGVTWVQSWEWGGGGIFEGHQSYLINKMRIKKPPPPNQRATYERNSIIILLHPFPVFFRFLYVFLFILGGGAYPLKPCAYPLAITSFKILNHALSPNLLRLPAPRNIHLICHSSNLRLHLPVISSFLPPLRSPVI